jgi:hypothetical protein
MPVPLLARTHYQVDEPAYAELLVLRATSPVQTSYRERVAQRFAAELRQRGKAFNDAAGGYAVDLGRGLGVLTDQHAWTASGHLLALIATVGDGPIDEELELLPAERVLHWLLFLEADGGALIYLAKRLRDDGSIDGHEPSWNEIATSMFDDVLSYALGTLTLTADRVHVRQQLDRLRSAPYRGKSGAHKLFLHLQTLCRLGVAERAGGGTLARQYRAPEDPEPLERFLATFPDLAALDDHLRHKRLFAAVAAVAADTYRETSLGPDAALRSVAEPYTRVAATGAPIAPLWTLIRAVQIELLVRHGELWTDDQALGALQEAQRERPKQVRFHVDRSGQPAFLRLSREVTEMAGSSG